MQAGDGRKILNNGLDHGKSMNAQVTNKASRGRTCFIFPQPYRLSGKQGSRLPGNLQQELVVQHQRHDQHQQVLPFGLFRRLY